MKKILLVLGLFTIIVTSPACKKKKGGDSGGCDEASISFVSNPPVNSTQTPAAGPNFPLEINISNMPSQGVSITVRARPESPANAAAFFTETRNSSQQVNNFTITNTPVNVASIVEITITSRSCSNNSITGSYRYSRK
jgi:hypothetical protein